MYSYLLVLRKFIASERVVGWEFNVQIVVDIQILKINIQASTSYLLVPTI